MYVIRFPYIMFPMWFSSIRVAFLSAEKSNSSLFSRIMSYVCVMVDVEMLNNVLFCSDYKRT